MSMHLRVLTINDKGRNFFSDDLVYYLRNVDHRSLLLGGDCNYVLQAKYHMAGAMALSPALLRLASNTNLKDVWEEQHGNSVEFTFMRNHSQGRLDRFYTSANVSSTIVGAEVHPLPLSDRP